MHVWIDVCAELFSPRYAWVTVLSAIVSARYAYVSWYKRRRSALVDSTRRDAIVELERDRDPRDAPLIAGLLNGDTDAVSAALSAYAGRDTMGVTQARRYVEARAGAIAYFDTHFVWTGAASGSLVILLIHACGAFVGETQDDRTAAQAANARLHVIRTAQMVSHIDSGLGHTIVLVVYRPDSANAGTVEALGAAAKGGHGQQVEFYPVACCVSPDSAAGFFSHSRLSYPSRFVASRSDAGTLATLRALGVPRQPNTSGYMSVIDPAGNLIAHWNALPDSSELREQLH